MNERGHYGGNGVSIGQQYPRTIYVEHEKSSSKGVLLLGALAVGGAILYARHQSQQIQQLYSTSGMPYQSFTGSLRETARALPAKAREAYRGIAARVRPAARPAAVEAAPEQATQPAHSVRARSARR